MVWNVARAGNQPAEKPRDKSRLEAVKEGDEVGENDGEIIISIKIPKPEALIFEQRMETKYQSVPVRTSFLPGILDSARFLPGEDK